jgi:hypothetical protein
MRPNSRLFFDDPGYRSQWMRLLTEYRYRPSPNRPYPMGQSSPVPTPQMMYSYGNVPLSGQSQPQTQQQMTRPSPPQPTWAVPQPHNSYYSMQRGPVSGSREESRHQMSTTNMTNSQSPALSSATFSHSMNSSGSLATTDYFPGVIDTSKFPLYWVLLSRS